MRLVKAIALFALCALGTVTVKSPLLVLNVASNCCGARAVSVFG